MITIKCYNTNLLQENTFVVTDDSTGITAIIDPGCYPEAMKQYLNNSCDLRYIILTHGHSDHIASVNDIKSDHNDVTVIANSLEESMLENADFNGSLNLFGTGFTVSADRFVADNDKLSLGDTELTFIATPGHSPGGMCIYADCKVLFSGDTLFKASIGRTDLYEGDFDALISSIKNKLFLLPDDTTVLPGHGPGTTIAYEKRVNPFV